MKNQLKVISLIALILIGTDLIAQDNKGNDSYQIESVFKTAKGSGGYGALTNKFTSINGDYANLVGVYGGWYVNHNFLLGVGGAGLTNDIKVPFEHRVDPLKDLSYMYGQFGMVTEYVIASDKAVHVAFNLFSGAGFTMQYERYDWHHDNEFDWEGDHDEDWFFVVEPGVQVELNLFRWMRFSPGISYRAALGSDARGLGDSALSDISYNATLKFGKF